jgi:hypothetical protein
VYNCVPNYNGTGVAAGAKDSQIDPEFVSASDYHLSPTSPLLNLIRAEAGDPIAVDLDGKSRPFGLGREMGCYEISDTHALWVYNVVSGGYSMAVLPDINGDGMDEVVVYATPTGDNIDSSIFVISGADGNTILWSYTMNSLPRGLTIMDDMDDDGIQDIIVMEGLSDRTGNAGDDAMYALSGAVTPPAGRVIWGPVGHDGTETGLGCGLYRPLSVPDVTGDGLNEIFANVATRTGSPCYTSDAGLFFGGADGSRLWYFTQTTVPSGLWDIYGSVATPDLSGDALADIVVAGATTPDTGGVQAWQGGGTEPVLIWNALLNENITNPSVVGDVNLDGVADIGVGRFYASCPTTPDHRVYVLSGSVGTVLWDLSLDRTPSSIENLGDVSGDGIEDVVIGTASSASNPCGGSDSSVYALEGNPGASTRVIWTYPLADQNSYVKVIRDTNGDGKRDVVVTGQMDSMLILSGADGSVLQQESFPNGSGIAKLADFNSALGVDILTSVGSSIYALSFAESGANSPPAVPATVSPPDEGVVDETTAQTLNLEASSFTDPDGDAHAKSYWEVERFDSQELLPSYMDSPSEIGLTSHPVQDALTPGLKYTWRVKYEDDNGAASGWSTMSSFKVGTPEWKTLPAVKAGKTIADYGMISIVHWPNDPSPSAVFNIRYDPRYYKIGTYDPVSGGYIEFGGNLTIEPGRAYWMLAREGISVNFNGIPVSKAVGVEVCLHSGADGWNMIAPPNEASYYWGEVEVGVYNEETAEFIGPAPIDSLTDDTIIDRRIWQWQEGRYVFHANTSDFVLEPNKGYWVKAVKKGAYLVFPNTVQLAHSPKSEGLLKTVAAKTGRWLKKVMPGARKAMAENDTPPMPMGALKDSKTDNIFGSCFVKTLKE